MTYDTMLINLKKHINSGYLTYFTLAFLLLLVFFTAGSNFLHNHEPDFKIHQNCPAHQLFLLFTNVLVFALIFFIIQKTSLAFIIFYEERYSFHSAKPHAPRAPPLSIQ